VGFTRGLRGSVAEGEPCPVPDSESQRCWGKTSVLRPGAASPPGKVGSPRGKGGFGAPGGSRLMLWRGTERVVFRTGPFGLRQL